MSGNTEKNAGKKTIYKGLCLYCKFSSECTFPRDQEKPVYHCEEFDDDISEDQRLSVNKYMQGVIDSLYDSPEPSPKALGLCCICENWDNCSFPKPEGGVWHCEEYK